MHNQAKWSVDCFNNEVSFKVKQLFILNDQVLLKRFAADIYTTSMDFSATNDIYWINASSSGIDAEMNDGGAKSANFFDVKNHRQITFVSNNFYSPYDGLQLKLSGELTMKGVCHLINLKVRFSGIVIENGGNRKGQYLLTGTLAEPIGEIFRKKLKAVDGLSQIPYEHSINLN